MSKITRSFSIEQSYLDALTNYAEEQDRSVNYMLGIAVRDYLASKGVKLVIAAEPEPQKSKVEPQAMAVKIEQPAKVAEVTKPKAKKAVQPSADEPKPLKQWQLNVLAKQEKAKEAKQATQPEPTPQAEEQDEPIF